MVQALLVEPVIVGIGDPETGQLRDAEIQERQQEDKFVQKLKRGKRYQGRKVVEDGGLIYLLGEDGARRVVLPSCLRAKALNEAHDSIYAGHLRTPQTIARVSRTYWWPGLREQVKYWVRSCRDCGTRKTRPTAVIPPLRSQGIGDVGDRWALDVAGPLPITANGNRYVIAAVDYASRYAVAVATPAYTATDIAKFLLERVGMVFGPPCVLVMYGAPWASPIVVIIKKNGIDIRLCVDYRLVNSLTVVSMTDRARAISAFITPFGLFEWSRMPFGLKNAPQIYQRLLDNTLYGFLKITKHQAHQARNAGDQGRQRPIDLFQDGEPDTDKESSVLGRRSYIDDILGTAGSWDMLCERVDKLLDACDEWNMSISKKLLGPKESGLSRA
ncbi:unnamed protein product [Phytophthora fragariaefolia]|uniref:Unnamed protein product n=1 Tax=Phytophthora fragariaefolia TaxID=1490495 RepID=A0A9W6Y2C0_9STRA|nr:unnamed protein product [Phytophthora fragariaefolia]